jgi:eukaryotic-like serine/threonine-protein kinase
VAAALEAGGNRPWPPGMRRVAVGDVAKLDREGARWASALAWLLRSGIATVEGRRDDALAHARSAEAAFRELSMLLHASVALRRQGELTGGAAGERQVAQADAWMTSQGIRNPARMTGMLAPGAFATD